MTENRKDEDVSQHQDEIPDPRCFRTQIIYLPAYDLWAHVMTAESLLTALKRCYMSDENFCCQTQIETQI